MKLKRIFAAVLCGVMCFSTSAFAAEEEVKEIRKVTYQEAVDRAVKYNSTIATINEGLELMEKNKESLYMNLEGLLPYYSTPVVVETTVATMFQGIHTLDKTERTTKYQKQQVEETMELMVKNYFNTIFISEKTIDLAKENLAIQQQSYAHSVIKHNLGMISDNAVDTARTTLENTVSNLKMAELALDNTYDSLGNLISLRGEEFVIDYELEYEPFNVEGGLTGYINRMAENDLGVKTAAEEVKFAKYQQMVSTYETTTYSSLEKENAVNSAERKQTDTVNSLKTNIGNAYNTIMQLEANNETLTNALNDAKTTYRTCELNYQIGNITELQLKQAALGVKNAEINLLNNTANRDLMIFQFNHPYMLNQQASQQQ